MSVERFPVEAGHILTFARAIGDTAQRYSDASFAATGFANVTAPPTFVQASAQFDPDYPLRPRPGAPWMGTPVQRSEPRADDASVSDEHSAAPNASADSQVLHAEQSFHFVRPVRVGDVLRSHTRTGKSWDKQGRRGGRMTFEELITEYRDSEGELVVTATAVTVTTARTPGQEE